MPPRWDRPRTTAALSWARRWVAVWRGRAGGGQVGSATVETVLLAGVVVLLTVLPVQAALWMQARHVAAAAAAVGAHAAASTAVAGEAAGRAAAEQMLTNTGAAADTVTVARSGTTATVTVQVSMRSLIPGLSMQVTQTSQREVDRFVEYPHA